MPSEALEGLLAGAAEIEALQRANPSPRQGGGIQRPDVVRAIGRAEVVLLSGHLERYLRALNEEAVGVLVERAMPAGQLSDEMRLLHSKPAIDDLALMQWDNRAERLREYSAQEASLWKDDLAVSGLDSDRLLAWMKSPTVKAIIRMFRPWGIDDVFSAVTRKPIWYARFRLTIGELVEKRNGIAHGDQTVEATFLDVQRYKGATRAFCLRVDRVMSRRISRITPDGEPW